ncbi:MAG: HlyD family secretion protein [Betaproteobacteria bacterium]|nr:HlyD family secretion protein [Betaproteobacteria bacterium]
MASEQPPVTRRGVRARASDFRARLGGERKTQVLVIVTLLLAAWAGHWLYLRLTHLHIDDARIDGEVITISSRVSGWVTELPVTEGDDVKKGQLLARVDDRDAVLQREVLRSKLEGIEGQMAVVRAQAGQVDQETLGKYESETSRLTAAQAEAASLEVQLKQAAEDYKRNKEIEKYLTQQEVARAQSAYQQAEQNLRKAQADVASARGMMSAAGGSRKNLQVIAQQLTVLARQADEIRAQIKRQEVDIADRVITSPADGKVVMTFLRKGEHVAPGQRIAMFHDPQEIWVEANVKETDVAALKPGMKADIHVDAYPGKVFRGEVSRIGQVATSKFALLPDPNPSGNFTKITQRLPVRIVLTDKDHALRPGMMVEVDIDRGNH